MYRTKINTRRNRYVPCAVLMAVIIIAVVIPGLAAMKMTPYLQAVTTNSVYVLVECDSKETAKVHYGETASYGASALTESTEETTNKTFVHNVKLTGLKPNTVYHYRASQQGAVSMDYTFRTAVNPGTRFRFAWMADCRSGITVHDEIAALIDKAGPYFSLYGGDLCSDPKYYVFKNEFFRPNELALIAKVPFFNAVGNHEDWDVDTKAFTQAPASASGTQDYYSFDYGDLHVLVLNTELNTYAGSPQYNFALSDLSSTKRTWKVVISHKPAYSYSNKHGGDPAMAAMAKNIFEPCKVNMVLSGHDHMYQHNLVNGVHHMVIGSAGATLYDPTTGPYTIKSAKDYNYAIVDVTPNVFDMTVYNNKGTILEKIALTKGGPAEGVSTAPAATPAPATPAPAVTLSPAPGPTPAPPAVIIAGGVVYEAEDAKIEQGVVETEHAGYTGAGYVNNKNIVGSYIEWTVNAASAGDYTLLFRFGNGGGATRYCDVIVNGIKVANAGFDSPGPVYPDDWRVWLIKTMKVTLRQGKNTIGAVSTVVDGPPNWDRIELAPIKTVTYKPGYVGAPTSTTVSTVSTFACISIYWSPSGGSVTNTCAVQYRKPGETTWKNGLDLWYDARTPEYRGSIVNLTPNTTYEIKLTLKSGPTQTVTAKTWSEDFPIAGVAYLPETSNSTLSITTSGTPSGYHLYTFKPGRTATIDVNNAARTCIDINASYIIIRGLTLKNAREHGIVLNTNAHHVVIEDCDISGWGVISGDGWGEAGDCGIWGKTSTIRNIIIQRNKIHHPRSDANNWEEARPLYGGDKHPEGPQGISLYANSQGNNVIRYNEIYSDINHCYNDCIGGGDNFSSGGFPGPDSDIYGNVLSENWDDAIECDGGGRNVRIWGNYFNNGFVSISLVVVDVGPTYCFRNISNLCVENHDLTQGGLRYIGRMFKASDTVWNGTYWGGGRTYLFHNTMLQKMDGTRMLGYAGGLDGSSGTLTNVVSRNNIYYVSNYEFDHFSIFDNSSDTKSDKANDLDYDLCSDTIASPFPSPEPHGIKKSSPIFDLNNGDTYNPWAGPLKFALSPGSPGYDAGAVIKNFNDGYKGSTPDMGAFEAGSAPMEFGVNAYKTKIPTPVLTPGTMPIIPITSPAPTPAPTPSLLATPQPLPFNDSFEDGKADGWTTVDGTWSVVMADGTYVYKDTYDGGNCWSYAGSLAWTDYAVEARVKPLSFNGTPNRFAGVFARFANDGRDYYALTLGVGNILELRKRVGGSSSVITSKTFTVNTGTWYTLKLVVDGPNLKGYVNGKLELTATDSSHTSGCVAVGMYKATAEFDDLMVTKP